MNKEIIKVLLVEDDEDDYMLTRDFLEEAEGTKYELTWIEHYEHGLSAICRKEHDVYLIDYLLGERNGLELLCEAEQKGCKGPFIMLTGFGFREVDVEAMKYGAIDFLIKHQLSSELLERSIRYAVKLYSLLKERQTILSTVESSEAANQARLELTVSLSHKVENEAKAIFDSAAAIESGPLTDNQRGYLKTIESSAKELSEAIKSSAPPVPSKQQTPLTPRQFSLRETLDKVIRELELSAKEKGQTLSYTIDPEATDSLAGDPDTLKQVFKLLTDCVIQVTTQKDVSVSVRNEEETEDAVVVCFIITDHADASSLKEAELETARQLLKGLGGEIWIDALTGINFTARFSITPLFNLQRELTEDK